MGPKESSVHYQADPDEPAAEGCWKPSIHMPRWASRLVLTIEHVRPERLQSISHHDIEQEGVMAVNPPPPLGELTSLDIFRLGWDALNAKRGFGWEENPWVWRICFRVQEKRNG
jgi:hypothetical protein